ncbi:LysR family transcriptional regulator [Vibrio salinus]|uniref:LysR family transcriptional regulator n=1 Tax=Vibrio salinus TaxID=2899784 RepID=UPI001E31659F|nr:LysR family transcriptional regulator [Vibrio salinus]MCE0494681.1 LysR family transcriptional regulator [Vibrio salinus]
MKSRYSLDDLFYFCAVAKSTSFKKAADELGIPLSTLSRRINKLESEIKVRLLNRDSHRVTLTNTGSSFYNRYKDIFDDLTNIDDDLHKEKSHPAGKIKITAPINASYQYLKDVFYSFLHEYADIRIDLRISNQLLDIESEGIDVVFRVGCPVVQNWISRPLKDIHFILCSSPGMDTSGLCTPKDLVNFPAVLCDPMTTWQLEHAETGEQFSYQPTSHIRFETNDIEMLSRSVKQGLGIGYLPDYHALPIIESGEIKRVLPEWFSKPRTLYMLYRDRDNLPLRVRLLIDYVLTHFHGTDKQKPEH